MNERQLIRTTKAFKTVEEDAFLNALSHAYLIVNEDADGIISVLKEIIKVMMRQNDEKIDARTDNLIEKQTHIDVKWYPKTADGKVSSEDITDLIADSFVKPYEADRKIYVLPFSDKLNGVQQNKLLKTLEEPRNNVYILLGASSEYPLLQTVKSRVKKLIVSPFTAEQIVDALSGEYTDIERLKTAAKNSCGLIEKTKKLYSDNDLLLINNLVTEVLVDMKNSSFVPKYVGRLQEFKGKAHLFIDMLLIRLGEVQKILNGLDGDKDARYVFENGDRYNNGSVVWAIEKIKKAKQMLFFNSNEIMVIEGLLFDILEGKYKWQKS